MMLKCSLHTHTTFCDGKNTPEEMVLSAIEQGGQTLGFSEHSKVYDPNGENWGMSDEKQSLYIREINRLKEKYADSINVLLGVEQDYTAGIPTYSFDYVIGSVHAVIKDGIRVDVDVDPQGLLTFIREHYHNNSMLFAKDYYALVADVARQTNCDIIGHFDLLTKFNEKFFFVDTSSKEYRTYALEAADALIEQNRIFEINTGAISRGWRKDPYPEKFILTRLVEKKADIILSSDTHSKETVFYFYDEAIEYARSCGVRELCIYQNGVFEKIKYNRRGI